MNSYSQKQMEQQSCQEETTNYEKPFGGGYRPQGAKFSMENFMVNQESLNRQIQQMTLKPVPTDSFQGDFIYRHYKEP